MQKSLPSVDWTRMLTALLHWMRQTRKDQRFNSLRTPRSRRSQESSLFDRLIPESLRSLLRASQGGRTLSLESYEDRLLYSAAPAPPPAPDAVAVQAATLEPVIAVPADLLSPEAPAAESSETTAAASLDLIVIDPTVPDAESLISRLTALQTDPDRILVLDSQRDGLAQIADRLEQLGQTRAIHILSHGDEAGLRLGSNWLSNDTLAFRAGTLASWQPYLTTDADLLFYGCDLAGNETGQEFLRSFGQLTGADVAASTDATGAALLGGDWNLEFQVGSIETPSLGQQFQLFDWNGLLASNTYQQGASSYTGTQDTAISATNPGTSYGTSTTVVVGGTSQRTGLIRFDSLFGNGPNQIPPGSTILSASLQLNVTTATSSDAQIALHRVLANWSETSTYSSLGSGLSRDDLEVCTTADAVVGAPNLTGAQWINGLEESLQAWSDGGANLGWAIYGNNSTNWAFSSSEAATASLRPMLQVSYTPPAPATVEIRTTGEVRVNAATTDVQTTLVDTRNAHGTVGVDASGNYVVVWTSSNSDGSGTGVFAQRYNARGVAQGRPILVNTTTTGDQKWGTVAVRSDGGFIVTWTSVGQDGSATGNYARVFDASGVGGSEILVNSTTTGDQYAPAIGVAADGSFVIAWRGSGPGDSTGIFFQKFTESGSKIGSEQRANTTTANIQEDPSIAVGQDGQFMVVWDDIVGTYGRRFDANGNALDSNQLLIHADATSGNADVATNGTGDYHIVWRTTGGGDGSGRGLWRISLGASDTAAGTPQQVTTDTINDQTEPAISSDADGNFMITWQGSGPGDTAGVFARKFLSDGTAVGTEFQLNETTSGSQVGVSTALVNLDNYIAVWSGNGPGDNAGIFMRAEGTLKNQASLLFTTSNNVTASGSSTVPNWTTGDVLGLGQPNLTLGDNTTGTLSIVGNVNAIANDGNVSLAGLDVIQHDVIVAVGANQVQLYAGDVLFSIAGTETLGALTVQSDDILIFRPAAPWNYAAGQISVLFDGIHNVGGGTVQQMADFDLVDVDTQVGDVMLTAGTLVVADSSGSNAVQVFHPTNAGLTTTSGTTQTLLKATEIPVGSSITGLHLVERDVRVGGINLESGNLIVSTNGNATIGTNGLAVTRNDVARLQIGQTSINGTASVTASMLVQGTDVALDTNQESFLSLAMVHVGDPPSVQDETYDLTEGDLFQSQDSWHMPGWDSRMQLTFNNSSRAENLDDFPILVTLDTNRFDYSRAQASGNDLRFVDANGTVLSYEVETWNPNGQSNIWVKVPRIDASSSTDSMWLYYGNGAAAAGQNAADVWSNGYVGVWHMNGNPSGTQAIQDSSSSNVDGTSTGMDATNQVNGPIGGALKFDGTSEYIRVATTSDDPTAVDSSHLTIEAWANSSGDTGTWERIVNRRHTVIIPFESYGLATSSSDGTKLVNSTGTPDLAGTTGSLPADRWRYVTGVLSGSTSSLYVDGALNATQTGVTSLGSSDDDITIGAGEMGTNSTISQYWRGGIDEVRLSNVARSAAWTSAQYASMTDVMITYGDRQTVAGVLDNDTTTASSGLMVSRVELSGVADFESVTVLDDGRVLADPGAAFESLGAGQTATRQIQYTVMDAYGNSDLGTATLVVHGENDAPVLSTVVGPLRLSDIAEDAVTNAGTTVSQILTSAVGTLITDVDTGARQGMAITGVNTTNGSWQFSLDGSTWSSLAGASDTNATLLDVTARVRFVPNANYNGNAGAITFRAWDQSSGANGQTGVNVSTNGGETAFSTSSTSASITVTAVNDAPVLTMGPALTVLEGGQITITSTSVNAIDVENLPGALTFTVTGGLGFGHLARTSAPGTAITTFTQAEINSNQIIYVHSGAESISDFVGLAVSDGQTIVTGSLNFTITPVNDAPTFDSNRITLNEGQTVTLTTSNLLTNDSDATATSLVYTVNSVTNGQFERVSAVGTAITTFTQDDINTSRIRFVHNGTEAAPAASLSVTDGTTSIGPRSMAVTFSNVNDPPVITTNVGITVNEGATRSIGAAQLTTTDSDNTPAQLTYSLSTAPAHGRLEKSTNPGVAITSFTQSDINAGTIRYVHDGGESTIDSFTFTVSDGAISVTGAFSIAITPVNDPPTLTVNALAVSEGQTVTLVTSQLDASDPDSSTLTFTVGGVTHGQFRNSATSAIVTSFTRAQIVAGVITFTHDGSETPPTATISVSDGTSSTAPVAISFTYTGVNDAPVIATNAGVSVSEGSTTTIGSSQLLTTDSDSAPGLLLYSVLTAPAHGRLERTTNPGVAITSFTQDQVSGGTIRYVHDGSNSTSDGFAFSVSDGALTAAGTFAITVTPVNDAPVISTNIGLSLSEGGNSTLGSSQLAASDADNTPAQLVYALTATPAHGRLERVGNPGVSISSFTQADVNSGSVRYVHDGSETTTDSLNFTLSDGGSSISGTISITISPVNDAPVIAANTGLSLSEGGTAVLGAIQLAANDSDDTPSQLVYTLTSGPAHGRLELAGNPGVGISSFTQADINSGTVRYVHDGGESTTDSLSFTLSDGGINVAGTVSISVAAVNDAPVLDTNAGVTVDEGGVIGIGVGQLLTLDDDNTPSQLIYTVSTAPAHGRIEKVTTPGVAVTSFTQSDIDGRALRYVHDGSESTSDAFVFSVSDGAQTVTGSFAVTVNPVNDSPVLSANVAAIVSEGGDVSIGNTQLLTSDNDNAPSQLTYTVTTAPAHGRLERASNPGAAITSFTQAEINSGAVRYVHDGSNTTTDSFGFTVSDGSASESGTFSVSITPVDNIPVMESNLGLTVNEGGSSLISDSQLLAVDVDNSASELIFTLTAAPSHGRVERVGYPGVGISSFSQADINSGAVKYVHDGSNTTSDAFSFSVSDGALSVTGTFHVTVTPVNDPPVITNNLGLTVSEGGGGLLGNALLLTSDSDNVPADLSYTVSSGPAHGRLERVGYPGVSITTFTQADVNSGAIRYVHDGSQTNADSFTFTVSDGQLSVTGAFGITVTAVNNPPLLVNNTGLTVSEGGVAAISGLQLSFSDSDNSPAQLVYSVTTLPSHGRLERNTNPGIGIASFTQDELNSGSIRYVHDGGETVSDSFTFSVTDGTANVTGSFAITITPVNDPPVLTTSSFSISEGQTITLTAGNFGASDPDNSTITFQVSGVTHGQFVNATSGGVVTTFTNANIADGLITFTHDGSQFAPTVSVSVTDGGATSSPINVSISFTPVNDPPVVSVNTGAVVLENGSVVVSATKLSTTDEEQAAAQLIYTVTTAPTEGRLERVGSPGVAITSFTQADLNGGQVRYVQLGSEAASDRLVFSVTDGTSSTTGQFNLSITPVNDPPVLTLGPLAVTQGATVTLTSASVDAADPDSAVLTFTVSSVTHGRFINTASGLTVTSFTTSQVTTGEIAFEHDNSELAPTGLIQVSDGGATTANQSWLFDFQNSNNVPSISPQTFTLSENAVAGSSVGLVIANDADLRDRLSYSILSGPSSGLFTIDALTGQIIVASGAAFDFETQPVHTLSVQVQDLAGATATATVTVQLTNVNEAPVALGFVPANGVEDGPALSIDLTRGFQDPDRTSLTFRIVSNSNPGLFSTAAIDAAGQLAVHGRTNAFGSCDLTIEASDTSGLTARTTLRINIASVNDAPVAVGETTTLVTGDSIVIDPATLLHNDSDLDGDTLTVVLATQPAHGKLIQNSNGTYRYQPDPGFSGLDTFTYAVTDGSATSLPVSMGIDVQIVATSGTSNGSGSGSGFTPTESASVSTDNGSTSTTDGTKGGSGTTGQATTNTGPAANGMTASGDSGAAGSNQKTDNSNAVGPITTRQNDGDLGVLITRKGADLSDFGPRSSKSQSDSDSQRERSHIQRALESLVTGGPQAVAVDLASSMASLQLTQLRHTFTSQANVAAFEQIAQSLNAEMGGELAFEVPALAGASLTVGYVVWMLRGGMLITSLLAQMPAWRIIDPLVVLDSLDKSVEDDESLGSLVEHGQSEMDAV